MKEIFQIVEQSKSIGIFGHIRPDGDCMGSTMALYNYLKDQYTENEKHIEIFLDSVPESFWFLNRADEIRTDFPSHNSYDTMFILDCGSLDRIGAAIAYFPAAKTTINIDHHISNTGFSDISIIDLESSSTCELLYTLMDKDKISYATAEALYLGIVHDTGVFKHSNTKRRTMEIAGALLDKGVSSSKIIDGTFYEKTFLQNQILGHTLMESSLYLGGRVILSYISQKLIHFYKSRPTDYDGIIDQLRITKGIEAAILFIEMEESEYKVSMRSNTFVDVSIIATSFGGGGHIRAAGCTIKGSLGEVTYQILNAIEQQME